MLAEANKTLESLGNEEVAAAVASSPNRTLQAGQLSALQNYKLLKTALIEQAEKRHEQNQRRFERLQAKQVRAKKVTRARELALAESTSLRSLHNLDTVIKNDEKARVSKARNKAAKQSWTYTAQGRFEHLPESAYEARDPHLAAVADDEDRLYSSRAFRKNDNVGENDYQEKGMPSNILPRIDNNRVVTNSLDLVDEYALRSTNFANRDPIWHQRRAESQL